MRRGSLRPAGLLCVEPTAQASFVFGMYFTAEDFKREGKSRASQWDGGQAATIVEDCLTAGHASFTCSDGHYRTAGPAPHQESRTKVLLVVFYAICTLKHSHRPIAQHERRQNEYRE